MIPFCLIRRSLIPTLEILPKYPISTRLFQKFFNRNVCGWRSIQFEYVLIWPICREKIVMGRLFVVNLEGKVYSCKHCRIHLGLCEDILSKVRSFIFEDQLVKNVFISLFRFYEEILSLSLFIVLLLQLVVLALVGCCFFDSTVML